MAAQQPAQALASHLVSQTLASVGLLETLHLISAADATEIRNRLPNPYTTFPSLAMNASPAGIMGGMQNMAISNPLAQPQLQSPIQPHMSPVQSHMSPVQAHMSPVQAHVPGPALPARNPLPPAPAYNEQRARALWDYNGSDPDDLQFRQGDTVIIDEEVNKEWFRGRLVGGSMEKGGLFPSNYVEKL